LRTKGFDNDGLRGAAEGLGCCCFRKPQKKIKNQNVKCKIAEPLRGDYRGAELEDTTATAK
jgi:hypothetical protein